jgi:hypothetical protein
MRYRLRTLLILLTVLPPLLAVGWFVVKEFRERVNENTTWESELSLIHGSGQSIEPNNASEPPPE